MKRILVVKLSALGDIVHCLPAVTQLRHAFPDVRIDWLVEQKNRILIDRSGLNVGILPIETRALGTTGCWKPARSLIRLIKQIRAVQYDCAIDFQGLIKSALLAYLSGAPRRIGFAPPALREPIARFFYTERVTPKTVHIVDQLHELLIPLGVSPARGSCSLSASKPADDAMRERLHNHQDYVVIHPGGGWPTKRWPLERFGQLAENLAAHGMPVVITSAPGEEEGEIEDVSKGIYKVTTTLDELIALCARARLFVGGDTGPLHMAAAMKIPLVAIFGPTASERNGPLNHEDIVVAHSLACRPCYKRKECPLGHWNCMQEISVEEVYQACLRRLASAG